MYYDDVSTTCSATGREEDLYVEGVGGKAVCLYHGDWHLPMLIIFLGIRGRYFMDVKKHPLGVQYEQILFTNLAGTGSSPCA